MYQTPEIRPAFHHYVDFLFYDVFDARLNHLGFYFKFNIRECHAERQ